MTSFRLPRPTLPAASRWSTAAFVVVATIASVASNAFSEDCDGDGVDDATAIADGLVQDCDGNGIPDGCDLALVAGFETAFHHAIPEYPQAFAIDDFDGDGVLDVAVGHSRPDDSVTFHRGLGDGRFEAFYDSNVFGTPEGVVSADFNGDGIADVAATANESRLGQDGVSVFLGREGNTPSGPDFFATGTQPRAIAAADVDGDGHVDIVTANRADDGISVLYGQGDGEFADPIDHAAGEDPDTLAIGDVDANGTADIVVGLDTSGDVSVLLGMGGGDFAPAVLLNGPRRLARVFLEDVDADAMPDIVASVYDDDWLGVFRSLGGGAFSDLESLRAAPDTFGHAVHDVDGDGEDELLIGSMRLGGVSIRDFAEEGDPVVGATWLVGQWSFDLVVRDVDGDGNGDLVTLDLTPPAIAVALGNGDGTFRTGRVIRPWEPDDERTLNSLAAGHIDADLRVDVVTPSYSLGGVDVWLGDAAGGFRFGSRVEVGRSPRDVKLFDVDGDGELDIVVILDGRDTVGIALGQGDGTFGDAAEVTGFTRSDRVAVGDVDGDDRVDIVTVSNPAGLVSIALADSDGGYLEPIDRTVGRRPVDIAISDVDGDGISDIVTANQSSGDATVVFGDAERNFAATLTLPASANAAAVAVADLDGDDRNDVAVADLRSGELTLHLATSGRGFEPPRHMTLATGARWLRSGDTDADGTTDLFYGSTEAARLGVLRGLGDGGFDTEVDVPMGAHEAAAVLIDIGGDGFPEIVVAHARSGALSVTQNVSRHRNGTDCNRNDILDACDILAGTSADVDTDGTPDECELDCDGNNVPDDWEIATGAHTDCNENRLADACDIALGVAQDCNENGMPDACDLASGTSTDFDENGLPDDCQVDCDRDGVPDDFAIADDPSLDCDRNRIPDACDIEAGRLEDCDGNGVPDSCEMTVEPAWAAPLRFPRLLHGSPTVALVDVDQDGVDEIISVDREQPQFTVFEHQGTSAISGEAVLLLDEPGMSLAAEDVNGDGIPDAVIGHERGFTVALGNGDPDSAFFELDYHSSAPDGSEAAHLCDLDGDGTLDLVLHSRSVDRIAVLSGQGDGSFEHVRDVPVTNAHTSIVADFLADGRAEIVVSFRGRIVIYSDLLGHDEPGAHELDLPDITNPYALAVADWNGDGRLDLTWAGGFSGRFITHRAQEDGSFDAGVPTNLPGGVWSFAVTERDGTPSLIVATSDDEALFVYTPTADGVPLFAEPEQVSIGATQVGVLPADLDDDGNGDLLVADAVDLLIVRGSPTGHVSWTPVPPVGVQPGFVLADDLDGDGSPDVVVADQERPHVTVLWGDVFADPERQTLDTASRQAHVLAFDLDGNGLLDLVTADWGDDVVSILHQTEARRFERTEIPTRDTPFRLAVTSVDGDEQPDLIVGTGHDVLVFRGQGGGNFGDPEVLNPPWSRRSRWLATADVDGDQTVDIAIGVDDNHTGLDGIAIYPGLGDGTFAAPYLVLTGRGLISFAVGDLNGDGRGDIVATHRPDYDLVVLTNEGAGSFTASAALTFDYYLDNLSIGDFDADGALDVAGLSQRGLAMIYFGDGDGTFRDTLGLGVGNRPLGLAHADIDLDGRMDFVSSNGRTGTLSLVRNVSASTSNNDCDSDGVLDVCQIAAGDVPDVDRDGVPDTCEPDCDESGVPDDAEIASGDLADCDESGIPDMCEIASGALADCDESGIPDVCEIASGDLTDCDENGVPDVCEIASGDHTDIDANGIPDDCEIVSCRVPGDCNGNDELDLSDSVCVFGVLFLGAPARFACGDGRGGDPANLTLLDWQPDGVIDVSDGIGILGFLFLDAPPHALAIPGRETTACIPINGCP